MTSPVAAVYMVFFFFWLAEQNAVRSGCSSQMYVSTLPDETLMRNNAHCQAATTDS